MSPKKILLIQLKQLGDVLMCTPAIDALARRFPHAQIHLLTMAPADQLVAANEQVSQVWLFPKKGALQSFRLIGQLKAERFDLVVDFYNKPISAMITRLSGAPRRIGYARKSRAWAYTEPLTPRPSSPYSAAERLALTEPLGTAQDQLQLHFPVGRDDQQRALALLESLNWDPDRPLLTLSPVSRQPYKVWPAARFAQVAERLCGEWDAQLLFLWGPNEEGFVEAVRREMTLKDLGDYAVPSLSETKALLDLADFHLGNDNGPMHFAIAAGCPSLAVFGKPLAENWMPPQAQRHLYIEHDPGCKRACTYPDCGLECLSTEAESVSHAALNLWAALGEERRAETARLRKGLKTDNPT